MDPRLDPHDPHDPIGSQLAWLLALSGAGALLCEVVWLRRLTLAFGSTGLALTLTLSVYMGGLGLGGLLAARHRFRHAPRGYGLLELTAACWAVALPTLLHTAQPIADNIPGVGGAALAAALVLGPPAMLHGATLPAAASALHSGRAAARLYAANTAGAVVGVLLAPLFLLPLLGVRGTELVAAACGATAGLSALALARSRTRTPPSFAPDDHPRSVASVRPPPTPGPLLAPRVLLAASIAGATAMSLEVVWSRLGSLLLGGSIYAVSSVLAVFLAGTALGAHLGRRLGAAAVGPALAALGLLAAAGTAAWRVLPHGLGLIWAAGGDAALGIGGALLLVLAMGGAPIASGIVFTSALASAQREPGRAAGQLLAANTAGSVLGSALTGLWGLSLLGLRGTVAGVALLAVLAAASLAHSWRARLVPLGLLGLLLASSPRWDPALYSVGLYLRVADFADLSPRAVERFAHDGFSLLSYADGRSATVAVGQSKRTGNRWLAINGKVDASTGDDMPTQLLSGRLPVAISQARTGRAPIALVVGLASGITAHAALQAGAQHVTVIELEPEVVRAAAAFASHNQDLLSDPRATIVTADARSWLRRMPATQAPFDVIISEPSNPWITGVSNLFTLDYWTLAQAHLAPDGVFCQWVQLYALPPDALRGLIATFITVFPDAHLYQTIPGADALLITGPPPDDLPLAPTLGPQQLAQLARTGRLNTDDQPWIELEAPRWLHRPTGAANADLIEKAAAIVSDARPL